MKNTTIEKHKLDIEVTHRSMEESEGDIGITKSAPYLLNQIEIQFDGLLQKNDDIAEADIFALTDLLEPFQDSPQLLDQKLEYWITSLSELYIKDNTSWPMRIIYTLCKIRGPKVISRFLSSRVNLLGLVLDRLVEAEPSGAERWYSRYILLIWLSILVLAPFSLDKFDSGFEKKLYATIYPYLSSSGKERDAAALVMARLVTRADVKNTLLENFFQSIQDQWGDDEDPSSVLLFYRLGVLQTTAIIWRIANATEITTSLDKFYSNILKIPDTGGAGILDNDSARLRKFFIKNLGRMSLIFKSDELETTIGILMDSLGDKDTSVRYTASKAVARVVQSLPDKEMSDEVIDALFSHFEEGVIKKQGINRYDYVSNAKWHGTLSCLAEILRRKVLPVDFFGKLADVLQISLQFEQRRLTFAFGANVRDSSCYVCWSLFRVYNVQIPVKVMDKIFETLVCLCAFDREVNIRRAASAAIQEGIGRNHGKIGETLSVEQGLQLIQIVDYLRIGLRSRAFLDVASDIYDLGYKTPTMHYVVYKCVCSWDPDVRRLGGKAVSRLARKSPDVFQELIALLLKVYNPKDFEIQHGVLYALGELLWDNESTNCEEETKVIGLLENVTKEQLRDENELLNCEAFLHLYRVLVSTVDDHRVVDLLEKASLAMELQKPQVVVNAKEMMSNLPEHTLSREMIYHWVQRAKNSKGVFAACFGQLSASDAEENGIFHALEEIITGFTVVEPMVRAQAVESLGELLLKKNSDTCFSAILSALDDYSVDVRGDVGSWNREAAMHVCSKLYDRVGRDSQSEIDKRFIRISTESLNKLRMLSVENLRGPIEVVKLVETLPEESDRSGRIYFGHMISALDFLEGDNYQFFLRGLVSSAGAQAGSEDTLKGSMNALVKYLVANRDTVKAMRVIRDIAILSDIKSSGNKLAISAMRVLSNLLEIGLIPDKFHWSVYVKAYNMHINTKSLARLTPSVNIICGIAQNGADYAFKRLGVLIHHATCEVRVRVAETLYEILINSNNNTDMDTLQLLGETNWKLTPSKLKKPLENIDNFFIL